MHSVSNHPNPPISAVHFEVESVILNLPSCKSNLHGDFGCIGTLAGELTELTDLLKATPEMAVLSAFKFIPGLIIAQATAAVLVYSVNNVQMSLWLPMTGLALIATISIAFWFSSLSEHVRKDALDRAKDVFAREREDLLVSAEINKRLMLEETHQRIVKETNRVHAKANFKVGMAFSALLCVGALFFSIQLMTLGLLTVSAAIGALAGYSLRSRHEVPLSNKKLAHITAAEDLGHEVERPLGRVALTKTTKGRGN